MSLLLINDGEDNIKTQHAVVKATGSLRRTITEGPKVKLVFIRQVSFYQEWWLRCHFAHHVNSCLRTAPGTTRQKFTKLIN